MTPEERVETLSIPVDLLRYATTQELAIYEKALDIELKIGNLLSYIKTVSPQTAVYPHVILLCDYIDALVEGRLYWDGPGPKPKQIGFHQVDIGEGKTKIVPIFQHPADNRDDGPVYNLVIHEPPRHGKSYVVSEHFPAYMLTKFPDLSGLLATYEQTFSEQFGGKIRDHIEDGADMFGVHVKGRGNAAKGLFTMEGHIGEFKAAGAGGNITGRGGHWQVLDDPIANSEDAMSEVIRQKHEDWWWSTWYNRRQWWPDGTPGRSLGMWTRWHEDDLRGRVIDPNREKWCVLNLCAIWEPGDDELEDPLGREVGVPLCPAIVPLNELIDYRAQTPLWFESMYQGRPFIAEGNQIKKPFQFYDIIIGPDGDETYRLYFLDGKIIDIPEANTLRFGSMDLAASKKTTADFTVMGVFIVSKTNPRYILVRAMERTRIETEDHAPFLVRNYQAYKLKYVLIEKQSYGTNLINSMQRQNRIAIRPVDADTDKVTRAQGTILSPLAMRQLFFPREASWYQTFERELLRFPNGTHDDQVDVLAYACQEFSMMGKVRSKAEELPGMAGRIQRDFARRKKQSRGKFHDLV